MNELIQIQQSTIGNETVQAANARELHKVLEVAKDFSTWIKAQIDRADLVENADYIKLPQKGEASTLGMQGKVEYFLTIDAGKNIAMMSGTAKGKEVRKYFIQCEKQLKLINTPQTYLEALKALIIVEEEKEQLKIELDKSKEWYTIKRVADMNNISWKALSWVKLKAAAVIVGQPTGKIFDANFSQVNTYSKAAFQLAYPELVL